MTASHALHFIPPGRRRGHVGIDQRFPKDPFDGIGKPEPLRGDLSGYWSRRIDDTNRLVYRATDAEIVVIACRYHYGD